MSPAALALGTLGMLLLGWAGWRLAGGYGRRDPSVSHLSAREAALVRAAADAAFPPGGPIPLSGSEAGIVPYFDRYLGSLPRRNRVLIRLLLVLVEHATLVLPAPDRGGFRRFSALSLAQRMAVLESWARSRSAPRRLVFQSLRAILTMGYLAHPEVLRATHLAPLAFETPVVEADLLYPAIGRPRASVTLGPADLARPVSRAPLDPAGPLHPLYAEPSAAGPGAAP